MHLSRPLSDPSQRLPVEIMSRIFAFSIQPSSSPLFLGAVCKTWRTITWSSPELWTELVLSKIWNHQSIEVICEWLARSGALPFTVNIAGPRCLPEDSSPFFDSLAESLERCSALALIGFELDDFARVFNTKIECQPCTETDSILEYLHLEFSGPTSIERRRGRLEPYLLDLSRHRPSIIILSGVFPSQLRSNWSGLTSASLYVPDPYFILEELIDLLEAAPRLESCWLRGLGDYVNRYPPRFHLSHRFVHQHLRRLSLLLYDYDSSTVETLFSAITLPSLGDLVISNDYVLFPGNVMNSFLDRSGCTLDSLQVGFRLNSENEEEFNQFLQASPRIRSLSLSSITDSLFNRLAVKPGECGDDLPFLPLLNDFTYFGPRTFSWQAFEQMVWRFEVKAKKHPYLRLSLSSKIEILSEGLTRRLATLRSLYFDISSQEGSWISASVRHWGMEVV